MLTVKFFTFAQISKNCAKSLAWVPSLLLNSTLDSDLATFSMDVL